MTCIVAIAEDNKVFIGADSAGVAGSFVQTRIDEKVFIKGKFIFGFTSSFRMGQLIRYKFNIPKINKNQDIDSYLYTDFIDSLIKCFRDNGFAQTENEVVSGGDFLFGYKGKLYCIQNDFQIAKVTTNYNAVGCGQYFALGCLFGLSTKIKPETRILKALQSAEYFSTGVRKPFTILSI